MVLRNGIYGTPSCGSLRLDIRRPDYFAPLLGFFGDALLVLGWRESKHHAAKIGDACLDLGVSEGGVDLPVELGQ